MNADPKPPFWLVWRAGGRAPVYKHDSYRSARTEAERLSRLNPGFAFYVLAPAARGVNGDEVYWSHCEPTNTPFDDDEHSPPQDD